MATSFDPQIFQAAILEVAEATKAAVKLAQTVQQTPSATSSPAGSPSSSNTNVDWSKLLNKPPLFEYKTTEDEIRAFRDWSWQLIQFLNTIDPGFEKELQALMDDPSNALDLSTASVDTRNRSAKLYGLLASLCRNRSLHVIRSVKAPDGYEALRQLTLALRPASNNRGLALMAALTSWPQFAMNQPLQPQLLKLEDALEEARRAGTTIPDQLKQAILLKCVSGQLRTHLNLAIQDTTSFKDLREHVLRWDRSQQKWSGLIFAEDNTATPMEVDRISAGKKGGKDKGKGYSQKGPPKGKSKGKFKSKHDGKANGKGKQKGESKGKYGGKQNDGFPKGKGGNRQDVCHKCGKPGHYARDCWSSIRNVQGEFQQVQPQQQQYVPQNSTPAAGGSPASSRSHGNSQQPQQPSSATQFRVARIHEFADVHDASDVQQHGEVVFDLRSPVSNAKSSDDAVRVVQFYIGDGPSEFQTGSVRTIIESMPSDSEMCNILIDSGADTSIFPASMSGLGTESSMPMSRLQDGSWNFDTAKEAEYPLKLA